jgi:hypothetical protein
MQQSCTIQLPFFELVFFVYFFSGLALQSNKGEQKRKKVNAARMGQMLIIMEINNREMA